MEGFKRLTREEMSNRLYPFFWQHGESHDVLGEYMEKIASGGVKGVCIEARPHPEFVQDGWWRDLDLLLEKAKELDMKLWILDDSHFPTGFANGRVKEDYPQYLKWYLDMRRYDVQGPIEGARIDFRLLKGRPWDRPDQSEKILGVYMAQRLNQRTEEQDSLRADSFIDITEKMDLEKRLLTLDIPAGAHSIFVVYQTRKGGEEATADYLNPLIKEATQVLINEVYEPHYAHYKEEFGKTIQGFFSDEPRFGNVKGTEGKIGTMMVLPWREGLEKELGFENKYLPLLWTAAEGKESDIRYRYMDVVTRLYNENFTKVIGDWCRKRGVWYLGHTIEDNGAHARLGYGTGHFFRGQQDMDFAGIDVIGGQIVPGMNYHHDAFNTGGSNGEFYHYALAKLGSSAAHLDPKKEGRVMCEAFGAYGWNEGLKMMKWIADHLIVRGVNWIVPHAFDPKEFPDFDCPPHFYAHGHNPQFRYFKVFSDYVNRMTGLFQKGKHPTKVGVFYPAELEWAGAYMPIEKPARVLTENQISFDIVSLDYLKEAKISEQVYSVNGQEMEVLVVPYGECFPEELSGILEKMCDSNIKICLVGGTPDKICASDNRDDQSERLERLISKCVVTDLDALGDVLKEYAAVVCEEPQTDLAVGEYVHDGKRYYMLFNENIGKAIHTKIRLSQQGEVYRYDGFQDSLVMTAQDTNTQKIRLDLEPYESAVLVVNGQVCDEESQVCDFGDRYSVLEEEELWTEYELPSEWDIRFSDSMSYPEFKEKIPQDSLSCVQKIPGWEDKTGTVRYAASIKIDKIEEGQGAVLNLGEVYETAEVFVNQKSAGVRICKPYTFDITGYLREGENELAIEVTNTLGTSVRDTLSHYLVIEPFGVQGPAVLKIEGGIR